MNPPYPNISPSRSTISAATHYLWLKFYLANPTGHWNGKCWTADPASIRPCCARVLPASETAPWPIMRHCRSITHVYHLHELSCSLEEFRKLCRRLTQTYMLFVGASGLAGELRSLAHRCAIDTTLEMLPAQATEAVLLGETWPEKNSPASLQRHPTPP